MHGGVVGSKGAEDVLTFVADSFDALLQGIQLVLLRHGDFVVLLPLVGSLQLVLAGTQPCVLLHQRTEFLAAGTVLGVEDALHQPVVGVHHHGVHVGHLAVEAHAALNGSHLLHAAHVFALRNHHGHSRLAQRGRLHVVLHLLPLRHGALEDGGEAQPLVGVHLAHGRVVLLNQTIQHVGIHAGKARLLRLALPEAHHRHVQLAVQQQHIVALCLGRLDVGVLLLGVGSVQIDQIAIFVSLVGTDERLVLVVSVVLTIGVLQQGKFLRLLIEVVLRQHAVVDEDFQVVPLLLKLLAVVLEDGAKPVAHLLGDVGGDFLHVGVALQVAAADVQRDVGAVDDAVQQRQEVGHDALHRVGHEHLVAEELNLVPLQVDAVLHAGEVEDARQVEGVVDVQVNPEQRLVAHRVEVAVERLVVLVLQLAGRACPQRVGVVDDVVLVRLHLLAVLPLLLLAEGDGDGQEAAVLAQQPFQAALLEELLAVVVDVQHDVGAALGAVGLRQRELRRAVARPLHRLGTLLPRAGDDVHALRHHEGAVEAQPEVADDGIGVVLVLLQEVVGAREGNLVDILVNLLLGHAHAVVADGDGALLLVEADADGQVAHVAVEVALQLHGLQLLRGIDGVRHHLAEENLMVGIEKLFDDGEDVLGRNPDVTFLHSAMSICLVVHFHRPTCAKSLPLPHRLTKCRASHNEK